MIQHAMLNYIEKYVDFGFKKLYYKKRRAYSITEVRWASLIFRCFWEKQEQHGSYGEVGTPHSLRRRLRRLHNEIQSHTWSYYTQPAALPQACVSTFVCVLKHCVGHLNACTVFSCFLHPARGGTYTQEVYHENLRIYRPQAKRPGLPGMWHTSSPAWLKVWTCTRRKSCWN